MITKTCRICKEDKPLSEYHPNKACKLGVVGTCRDCCKTRISKWYSDNRHKRQEFANQRNRDRKQKAVEYFGGFCADCKGTFPNCVFQFHHLAPDEKDVNPSQAMVRRKEAMWAELKKCVMLCANCHLIRHHGKEDEHYATVNRR